MVSNISGTWTSTINLANGMGWLDVILPVPLRVGLLLLGLWVIFASCVLGTRQWARRVVLLTTLYFLVGIVIAYGLQPTGFGLQPRFFLPGWSTIVTGSGLHLSTLGPTFIRRIRTSGVVVAWLIGVTVAAFVMARRHEVGSLGPIWFFGSEMTAFRPFGGYAFLTVIFAIFVTLGAVVAFTAHIPERRAELVKCAETTETTPEAATSQG